MKHLRAVLGSALIVFAAFAIWKIPETGLLPPLLFWNTSNSVPPGVYVSVPWAEPQAGRIIVLKDPPHFRLWWLMKRVIGEPGDLFCWSTTKGTHLLNRDPMPPPWRKAIEMGLPVWHGCKTLSDDEVVGYGDSPDSYDSRYLGPIPKDKLYGVYAPLWLFENGKG